MTEKEETTEVKAYFRDIANGSTDPTVQIQWREWGGAESLTMAANAIQQPIFQMAKQGSEKLYFTVFKPATKKIGQTMINSGSERLMQAKEWIAELRASKEAAVASGEPLPLVIFYDS